MSLGAEATFFITRRGRLKHQQCLGQQHGSSLVRLCNLLCVGVWLMILLY